MLPATREKSKIKKTLAGALGVLVILAYVNLGAEYWNLSLNHILLQPGNMTSAVTATRGLSDSSSTTSCQPGAATSQELLPANWLESTKSASLAKEGAVNTGLIAEDQLEFCQANNFITNIDTKMLNISTRTARNYSIGSRSFQRHHDRFCENSTELLEAIANGHRSWGNELDASNFTTLEKESTPSFFVPHGCDIPYLKSHQYCAAANQFTDIVIQGDSQSRHLQQSMLMSYRGDIVRGGILPSNNPPQRPMHRCHCDATFSKNKFCRPTDGLFVKFQPYQLYMCPQVHYDDQFTQHFSINRVNKIIPFEFTGINCTASPDYKGLMLYIQGGVHWRWNPRLTFRGFLKTMLTHPVVQECAEAGKLTLIWSGYTAQSLRLDEKYQDQSMDAGLQFDATMKKFMKNLTIPTIQWIPLTVGAATADGLHYTTDVNLERAQHVMLLASMLKKEGYGYQSLKQLV